MTARAVIAALLAGAALAACGDGDLAQSLPRAPAPPGEAGLVARRADGSRIEFPGRPLVWCGPWNDEIPETALQVAAIDGVKLDGEAEGFSYWQLWAIPADIERGRRVHFPGRYTFDRPRDAVIFIGDYATKNEASTREQNSRGWIAFSQASCEVGAPIAFTIDAVVGSEFGTSVEPLTFRGTFRGVVAPPPAAWYD